MASHERSDRQLLRKRSTSSGYQTWLRSPAGIYGPTSVLGNPLGWPTTRRISGKRKLNQLTSACEFNDATMRTNRSFPPAFDSFICRLCGAQVSAQNSSAARTASQLLFRVRPSSTRSHSPVRSPGHDAWQEFPPY